MVRPRIRFAAVLLALAIAALTGACQGGAADEVRSDRDRAVPAAGAAQLAELARGNSAFAFDLYRTLRGEPGNLFFSPHSISLALAMTHAGAAGETERQLAEALRFPLAGDELHAAFNALDRELAARGADGEGFRLHVANAVWGQNGHEFLVPFLDVLGEHYGAGVRRTDFRAAPDESRIAINEWVAGRTEDRIAELIPPGVIDGLTRLVLANAVYFKAAWALPFEQGLTRPGPFRLPGGGEVETPMMRALEAFGYARGDGWQAVELAYEGAELSMVVLLPDEGRFRAFEDSLDAALVSRMLADIRVEQLDLTMPKFEFGSRFMLAEALAAMGMTNAFDSARADFSGMDGRSCLAGDDACLYLKAVVHQAFVSVDEEGTEAAAATAAVMTVESAGPTPIVVSVDRPFLFLIRDRATEAILFLGRFERPQPE